jgi:hypothetical protein
MPDSQLHYCATDKELYDLLMASKQRITESILLGFARERGIFCSPRESRESLVDYLSLLTYTYADLDTILGHRAATQRTERRMSIRLRSVVNLEDIKAVCAEYKASVAEGDEKVVTRQDGTNKYTATVNYSELDYSKTRLLQRREKEAEIEFFIKDHETIIRMPANPKAQSVVDRLKQSLDVRAQCAIPSEAIELTHLKTPEARTRFFTSLITSIPGYKMENVTDIKVESKLHDYPPDINEDGDEELNEADETALEDKAAERAMLSVVENIALKGQGLLSSSEYQQLKEKGFFITNIVWKSRQLDNPYHIIEFDAGFNEPREGKGFKYNVRGVYRYVNGIHTTTLRQIPKVERPPFFDLLEQTARQVLSRLTDDSAEKDR